jgi:hypothetical protein
MSLEHEIIVKASNGESSGRPKDRKDYPVAVISYQGDREQSYQIVAAGDRILTQPTRAMPVAFPLREDAVSDFKDLGIHWDLETHVIFACRARFANK